MNDDTPTEPQPDASWRWALYVRLAPRRRDTLSTMRPAVGDLVIPTDRGGTWRLGRVEEVTSDGRYRIRKFVAPPGAYEGSIATYAADEIAVIPVARVIGRLEVVRAELAEKAQLERQITEALAAVEQSWPCACGGGPGEHADGCVLARALGR